MPHDIIIIVTVFPLTSNQVGGDDWSLDENANQCFRKEYKIEIFLYRKYGNFFLLKI